MKSRRAPAIGARTSAAVRRAIQNSPDSIRTLAARYGIDPKTVLKWRQRKGVDDRKAGRKRAVSSLLSVEDEALIAVFRQHVPLSLDQTLEALRIFMPQLTRSSLHRFLQRHGLSRRPGGARDQRLPPLALADHYELRHTQLTLAGGKRHLFAAVELSSRFAFAALFDEGTPATAARFLGALIKVAPGGVRVVETALNPVFVEAALVPPPPGATRNPPAEAPSQAHAFASACRTQGVVQQLAALNSRWSARQIGRVRQLVEQAVARRYRDDDLDSLRARLAALLAAYNGACRLRAFDGQSPLERARGLAQKPPAAGRSTQKRDAAASPRTSRRASRTPQETRQAILQAARGRLAHDGPEGLSLAEVARIAGVNRGTAYQHFETRDKLIAETADWVSEKLFEAVFGDVGDSPVNGADVAGITDRLASFAMDNPELCRAWLLKVLSSPDPASDLFWRHYQGSTEQFSKSRRAQQAIDTEVLSVIMLAGAFLWPVWARSKAGAGADPHALAHRFAQEGLRISMYGNLRSEYFPEIAERLATSI